MVSHEAVNFLLVFGATAAIASLAAIGIFQASIDHKVVNVTELDQAGHSRYQRKDAATGETRRRPNVIMLLAEDLGYGDLKCMGHPYARTPNIDSIARDGMKFMSFHSTGKTCAPARGGLMTGNNPSSMKYYYGDDGFDINNMLTVTELFHNSGYRTGHVGKWHIGDEENMKNGVYGIDYVKKRAGGESDYWYKDETVYDAAIEYIKDNREEPFYLNVWGHVAHSPIKPKEHLADMFDDVKVKKEDFGKHFWPKLKLSQSLNKDLDRNMAYYLGGLFSMDYNVGRLLKTIDELGLRNDTIIAFTGDHGAATMGRGSSTSQNMLGYCGGLRDYKHSYYEGGVRVPFLVRWPGTIPAGKTDNSPMSFLDWLPTACSLAAVPYKESSIEGENFSDVWLGGQERKRDRPLYWNKEGGGDYAMLSQSGEWKLHFNVDGRWELYNLKYDIEENKNLVQCEPTKAKHMKTKLREWTKTLPSVYCRSKRCKSAKFGKLDRGKDLEGSCTDYEEYMSSDGFVPVEGFPKPAIPPVEANRDDST